MIENGLSKKAIVWIPGEKKTWSVSIILEGTILDKQNFDTAT